MQPTAAATIEPAIFTTSGTADERTWQEWRQSRNKPLKPRSQVSRTSHTMKRRSQEPSGKLSLFSLSPELRIEIYKHALCVWDLDTDYTITINRAQPKMKITQHPLRQRTSSSRKPRYACISLDFSLAPGGGGGGKKHHINAPMLRSSRQVYSEALPLLYSRCIFKFSDNYGLVPVFRSRLGPLAANNITKIQLNILRKEAPGNSCAMPEFWWANTCREIGVRFPHLQALYLEADSMRGLRGSGIDPSGWIRKPLEALGMEIDKLTIPFWICQAALKDAERAFSAARPAASARLLAAALGEGREAENLLVVRRVVGGFRGVKALQMAARMKATVDSLKSKFPVPAAMALSGAALDLAVERVEGVSDDVVGEQDVNMSPEEILQAGYHGGVFADEEMIWGEE